MAVHLENDIFPALRAEKIRWLILTLEARPEPGLLGIAGQHRYAFRTTPGLVSLFHRMRLRELRLDTQLEFGQILESLLMLLYARGELDTAPPESGEYAGWRRRPIASHMRGEHGYHKFCSLIRFDAQSRAYEVEYYYCELFLSRVVKNYIEGHGRYRDHRTLFQAAPRAALIAFAIFLSPLALVYWNPAAAEILWVLMAALTAIAFGVYTYMVGTLLYTREHHDQLIQDYVRQVRKLSRFPETDPNPIIELTPDHEAVYMNPAARMLLEQNKGEPGDVTAILPPDFPALVDTSLQQPEMPLMAEAAWNERTLNFVFSAFPEEQTVIASGRDVTYLKEVEEELRRLYGDVNQKRMEVEEAYAQVDAELKTISDIQNALLPRQLPEIPGLELAVYYATSKRAGGDYYDFFPLPGGSWGILLADVSGHGSPAAVLMAITHAIAHLLHERGISERPAEFLDAINTVLCRRYTEESGNFITAFYAIYAPDSGRFIYASAGHPAPRLKREAQVSGLSVTPGLPLGIQEPGQFPEARTELLPGEALTFYTDGIIEAMDTRKNLFGMERLDSVIAVAQSEPEGLKQAILDGVEAFSEGLPPADDQTLLCLRLC